jgi:hypothetical protein
MEKHKYLWGGLFALIFFIASFITLKDYGISWDETIHFRRGQAYVHYFLTGKLTYNSSLPKTSLYQSDIHNGEYFIKNDSGHPPINDEIAAFFNYILYQKLGVLGDIQSFHIFNILSSSLLVFIVAAFAYEVLGLFPSLVSVLALTTYPLFWAESHFNIKDPPEAAFFSGFIWAFYKSLKNFSIKWLFIAILFFSLGLGTKFNILFVLPIILIYIICRYGKNIFTLFSTVPKVYIVLLVLAPFISFGILTISWPFLWNNWFGNLVKIFAYYKNIGTATNYQPASFYFAGFNTFPILWIIYTSPPLVLILGVVGIVSAWLNRKKFAAATILWLIWLIVPILRVSVPGSSIYGGVRQIMEFLPALALLTGLGAYQIGKWFKNNHTVLVLTILVFIWPIFVLFKLHPNENVYFNFLIGGLEGAQSKNFPSWGNSFGNAYLQGASWINRNLENGAKLSLIQGTASNVPSLYLRKDIDYLVGGNIDSQETYFSGIERKGEYLMELTFNDTGKDFYYAWEYVDKFLVPVYELKVDGVAILKIWKNDIEHTNANFLFKERIYKGNWGVELNDNIITVNFGEKVLLSHVELGFVNTTSHCSLNGNVDVSTDGKNWVREKDGFPQLQIARKSNVVGDTITYYFAAREAKQIRFWFDNNNLCRFEKPQIKIYLLE